LELVTAQVMPPELLDELLELEELLDELELLLDDELLELELEELELDEDELLFELDELLELPDDELSSPVQTGGVKLPLCVPWNPKLALCPAVRLPFHATLPAVTVLPDVETPAFQELVTPGDWLNCSVTFQLLIEVPPVLVTVTFNT
jgi:hypothetical protein